MGAGGSGLALSAYLLKEEHGDNIPKKIIMSNRRPEPLEHARRVHEALRSKAVSRSNARDGLPRSSTFRSARGGPTTISSGASRPAPSW